MPLILSILRRSLLFLYFIFINSNLIYASYLPPGGNNNDVQYKNGFGFNGSDNFVVNGNNVGIGTSTPQGSLVVMNGNVGIGTWVPGAALTINGNIQLNNSVANSITANNVLDLFSSGMVINASTNGASNSNYFEFSTNSGNTVWLAIGAGGNVGISNYNPVSKLSVSGNASIGSGTAYTTIAAPTNGLIVQSNVGIGTFSPFGGGLIVLPAQTGNVGIGSLTPGQALDVTGTVRATQFLGDGSQLTGVTGTNYWLNNGGTNVGINTTQAVGIGTSFVGGPGEATLSIMNGNVGIGTWVPAAPLDVPGNVNLAENEGSEVIIGGNQSGGGDLIQFGQPGGSYFNQNGTLKALGGIDGAGYINVANNSQYSWEANDVGMDRVAAGIMGVNNGSFGGYAGAMAAENIGIGTSLITTSALTVMDGNVGIGTWVPAALLQVGPGNSGTNIPFFATSTGVIGALSNATFGGILIGGNASTDSFKATGGSTGVIVQSTGGSLTVESANGTGAVITLTSGGNVGIGSVTPGQALDVNGTIRMSTNSGGALIFADGTSQTTAASASSLNYWLNNGGTNVGINTTQAVGIGTSFVGGTGEAALSVMNGNVGIGTWVPGQLFTVGANGFEVKSSGNVAMTSGNLIAIGNGNWTANGVTTKISQGNGTNGGGSIALVYNTATTDNIGINTTVPGGALEVEGGNVGIGSNNPGQALDVTGTVRATAFVGDGSGLSNVGGGSSNWTYSSSGNVGLSTTANVGIGTSFTSTAGLTVMNGNVGIGTWVPGNSLDIVGGNIGIGTGYNLVGIGTTSTILTLRSDTSSIYAGWQAGAATTGGGNGNAAFGYQALNADTNGNGNTAMGYQALNLVATNNANTAFGYKALAVNIHSGNTAVGYEALLQNTTGTPNTAIGWESQLHATGSDNVSVGSQALDAQVSSTGNNNTTVGDVSLFNISSGQNNTALGYQAGYPGNANGTQAGSDNLWLGANSGPSGTSDVSNSVGIGSYALAGANNVMVLGGMGANALNVGIGTDMNSAQGSLIVKASGSSNGNVGIGTLSPHGSLDVGPTGTICFGSSCASSWSAGGSSNWTYSSSGNIGLSTTAAVGIGTSFVGGAGEAALSIMNGNVGIGTWVPGATLDVLGTLQHFYVSQSGNVGIGFSSPTLTLEVNGHVFGTDVDANNYVDAPNIIGNLFEAFSSGKDMVFDTYNSGNEIMRMTNGQNVGIGTTVPIAKLAIVGNVGIGTITGDAYLTTTPPSGGMIVEGNVGIGTTIASNGGLLVMNGNVGIGTWVPNKLLDVGTNHTFTVDSTGLITTSSGLYVTSNGEVIGGNSSSTGGGTYIQGGAGINSYLNLESTHDGSSATTDSIKFLVGNNGGTEAMRIQDNSGVANIGIGTTVPASMLDVEGTLSPVLFFARGTDYNVGIGSLTPGTALDVNGAIRSTTGGFIFPDGSTQTSALGNNSWSMSGGNVYTTTESNNVGIGTSTPQGGLVVTNGNVGIGTWVPGSLLSLQGTTVSNQSFLGFQLTDNTGPNTAAVGTTNFSGTSYPGIWLNQSTPSITNYAFLGITGQTFFNAANSGVADLEFRIANQTHFQVGNNGTTVNGSANIAPSNPLQVDDTSNNPLVTILNAGNVGIGTWVPGAALQVNGAATFGAPATQMLIASGGNIIKLQGSSVSVGNGGFLGNINGTAFFGNEDTNPTNNTTFLGSEGVAGFVTIESTSVTGNGDYIDFKEGNVGVGTVDVMRMVNGNVGIGSINPGTALDVNGALRMVTAGYVSEVNDGSSGTSQAINWTLGNHHLSTLTGNVTYTFTNPPAVANLTLKIVQGSGPYTASWPSSAPGKVYWPSGVKPAITTANGAVDIVSCYFDGTNYYCQASQNMS